MNKELENYLLGGERFTILKGYKFDKLIYGIYVLVVLALFLIVFISNGSDRAQHIFYKCDVTDNDFYLNGSTGQSCLNPFYNEYPICQSLWSGACNDKLVSNGFQYGEPAPAIVKQWIFIVLGLLLVAFVINHFIYNKGFQFDNGGENE
jgi:hypothetical protein